jgi:peptidoglycan hydrolase-like protein with peptidoglycan-binding domain
MRNLLGRTSVALSAVALAVGLIAASSATASASAHATTHARPDASSSLCHFTGAQPVLSEGSGGTAVRQAQCEINWAYAFGSSTNFGNGPFGGLTVDGSFGRETLAATKAFQGCAHLAKDGIIGPNTWSALNFWVNQPRFC